MHGVGRRQKLIASDPGNPYTNGPSPLIVIFFVLQVIPILVACALNSDLRNSLNMGVIFFDKRASAAQIGIKIILSCK
jgi:hypothetical protein